MSEIIHMACIDNSIINNMKVRVYPVIAEKFDVAPSSIERAIRTLIKRCWYDSKEELQKISLSPIITQPPIRDFINIVIGHLQYSEDL